VGSTVVALSDPVHALLERSLPPVAFEVLFLSQYKNDPERWSPPVFDVLETVFSVVDEFVESENLRAEVGGLDADELRTAVERALELLAELTQQGDALHG